jgi:hypothetical protein
MSLSPSTSPRIWVIGVIGIVFLSTEKRIIKCNLTAKPRIPLRGANVNYDKGVRITWEEGERGQVCAGGGTDKSMRTLFNTVMKCIR